MRVLWVVKMDFVSLSRQARKRVLEKLQKGRFKIPPSSNKDKFSCYIMKARIFTTNFHSKRLRCRLQLSPIETFKLSWEEFRNSICILEFNLPCLLRANFMGRGIWPSWTVWSSRSMINWGTCEVDCFGIHKDKYQSRNSLPASSITKSMYKTIVQDIIRRVWRFPRSASLRALLFGWSCYITDI